MLEIKDYHSPDVDNVWEWDPADKEDVFYLLEINIGLKGKEESDIFQLIISTPEALLKKAKNKDIIWGRGFLIINNYSFNKVEEAVDELIKRYSSKWKDTSNVQDIFSKINKELKWEYDGYNDV